MRSKRRNRETKKILPILLPIFILGFVVFWIFFLTGNSRWDGQRRFSLVFNSSPVLVFTIEPRNKRAAVFTIPDNTLMETGYGYGTYPVQSVYHFGELDNKRGPGKVLARSIENTFGIWIDGYYSFGENNKLSDDLSQTIDQIKKRYFSFFGIGRCLKELVNQRQFSKTNLSLMDQMKLWWAIRKIRSDNISILDFESKGIFVEEKLPDGSMVKRIDPQLSAIVLTDHFMDRGIRAENISIEIVNAAGVDRLATQFANLLVNLGASVMIRSTHEKEGDFVCQIYLSNKSLRESLIVKRLVTYYNCQVKEENETEKKVELRLILGKDFYQ